MQQVIAAAVALQAALIGGIGWRGDGTGRYPDADPVLTWSGDENVVWAADTPSGSNATPVVVGDRVVVTGEPAKLYCYDKASGELLWQADNSYETFVEPEHIEKMEAGEAIQKKMHPVHRERNQVRREIKKIEKNRAQAEKKAEESGAETKPSPEEEKKLAELKSREAELGEQLKALNQELNPYKEYLKPSTHGTNGYASATPVSDGKNVYVLYGLGVAACHSLAGERQWIRMVDKPRAGWGHSASPLVIGDRLILHVTDVVALDVESGEELWRTPGKVHFGSPVAVPCGDDALIVTPHGDFIRASDGEQLASCNAALEYNAPLIHDGVAYFVARANGQAKAVRLPDKPEPFEPQIVWEKQFPKDKGLQDRYYASPLFVDGLIYAQTQKNVVIAVEPDTGELVYVEKLGGPTGYPSPTLAGEHIFVSNEAGQTTVVKPGRTFGKVGVNRLSKFRTCPIFEGERMYIRALDKLYCIGK